MLIIIGTVVIVTNILESLDLFLNGKNISLEKYDKSKLLYYSLIGVGIGMLVGGLMLLWEKH